MQLTVEQKNDSILLSARNIKQIVEIKVYNCALNLIHNSIWFL